MKKIIASLYPSPFDEQIRHELNASIFYKGKIYSYEEAKITSVKNDGTTLFPERSLFLGFKELGILPKNVDLWVLPKPSKIDVSKLYLFFSFIKAFNGPRKKFDNWFKKKILFIRHQDLHAHQAIGGSGFKKGVYYNIDGGGDFGDRRHSSWGEFKANKLKEFKSLKGLNSLANFHSFITEFCGFHVENGKVSGLASYGKVIPELKKKLEKTIKVSDAGIIFERKRYNITDPDMSKMNCDSYDRTKILRGKMSYTNIFKICKGYLPQDTAITAEQIISEKLIYFLKKIKKKYFNKINNIVFSGGLFLNVKINNDVEKAKIFKKCFFPMSPSDSGLSLGGLFSQKIKINRNLIGTYGLSPLLGPSFTEKEIFKLIKNFDLNYSKPKKIAKDISAELQKQKIVGIFNGKAEFGQRSLGSRSILADPRNRFSKNRLNQKIKKRDWFMPFAPAVLDNKFAKYFESNYPSMYMQKAEKIEKKYIKTIPSAVHINGTCRAQYVDRKIFPFFWKIINEFYKKTSVPMVLNTSFNRHGISTISSPRQAIQHLLEGNVDLLYIESYKIELLKNRKINIKQDQLEKEEDLLKQDNKKWLEKYKKYLSKSEIMFYKKSLKSN